MISGYACLEQGAGLQEYEFDPGPLAPDEVEIAVEYCGICHSDLGMIDNEWGISAYPFIPGHEAIGKVVAIGNAVDENLIGSRVGVGWQSSSCTSWRCCINIGKSLILLTLRFSAKKRNLLIPLSLSGIMQQRPYSFLID